MSSAYAQELTTQIAALGVREAALGEQYDAGVVALQQANARVAAAAKALTSAKVSQGKTVVLLRQDAVQAYVGGGPALELAGPWLRQPQPGVVAPGTRTDFRFARTDALDSFQFAAAEESTAQAALVLARNADRRRLAGLQTDRQQVLATQNNLVGVQQQVKGQIATLVAEIQREQELAAQRAEDARLANSRRPSRRPPSRPRRRPRLKRQPRRQHRRWPSSSNSSKNNNRPSSRPRETRQAAAIPADTELGYERDHDDSAGREQPGPQRVLRGGSAAVAAAESRVGDPYVWGAAGPTAFDCSGLVMWAYEQAGISLPHYSGAQFSDTTEIPMSDLQPGDLVFPANPGEHVAMYVGGGDIVQAPYTGADVQIVPLSSFFVLAAGSVNLPTRAPALFVARTMRAANSGQKIIERRLKAGGLTRPQLFLGALQSALNADISTVFLSTYAGRPNRRTGAELLTP